MRQRPVFTAELALIGATRGMLGFGIGLLLADRLHRDHRRTVGAIMLAVGALSTIPLAIRVFRRKAIEAREEAEAANAGSMTAH
jgi:hypothetical protein